MSLINLNTYPAAGSVGDTDHVIINGQHYTALQLQAYVGGDETTFNGTEEILKVDKNTGRGKLVTLAQLKAFVNGSSSPVTTTDIFPVVSSGTYKKATGTIMQSYLDAFDLTSITGLQVWYDITDNSSLTLTGSTIDQIRDKSGNSNHINTTGSPKPSIETDALTGKQVAFNGNAGFQMTNELSNSTFTFFLVVNNPNAGAYLQALIGGNSQNDRIELGGNTGNGDSIISAGGGGSQTYQDDFTVKQNAVICVRQQSGTTQIWEFNGRNHIRTTGTVPSVAFKIGWLLGMQGSYPIGGWLSGFVYYDTFLSTVDAQKVAKKLIQTHNINPGPYYKLLAFGDSYTVGIGASSIANAWAYKVAASLGKVVANAGISGSRFQDITGSDTLCGYNRYTRDLLEYPYTDRVYILYGFNDITNISASASQYQTQLDAMIADMINKGYDPNNIFIGTVPRMYGDANSVTVQAYGDAVRAVCTAHGCHCAEVYAAQVAGGGDSLFSGDNLHPNDAGHTVIANAFLAA